MKSFKNNSISIVQDKGMWHMLMTLEINIEKAVRSEDIRDIETFLEVVGGDVIQALDYIKQEKQKDSQEE